MLTQHPQQPWLKRWQFMEEFPARNDMSPW